MPRYLTIDLVNINKYTQEKGFVPSGSQLQVTSSRRTITIPVQRPDRFLAMENEALVDFCAQKSAVFRVELEEAADLEEPIQILDRILTSRETNELANRFRPTAPAA